VFVGMRRLRAARVGNRQVAWRSNRARRVALVMVVAAVVLNAPGVASAEVPFPEVPNDGWDVNGDVFAVKVVGSTVYVGGTFTEARGPGGNPRLARSNLAAFDMVTGAVLPFAPDPDGVVSAIESDGSTVWIGGNFNAVGGTSRHNLAALDASTGAVESGFDVSNNGPVYGLSLGNGRLYAAGFFTVVEGVVQQRVASLDPASGLPDPAFQAGANSPARALAVSREGRLFAAGRFTSIGGRSDEYLAELDPVTGAAVGPGFSDVIAPLLDVAVTPDGSRVFGAVAGFQNRASAWSGFTGDRLWYHRAMGDTQAVGYHDGTLYFGFHEGFAGDTSVRLLAADALTGELEDFRPTMNSFFGVWAIDASSEGLVPVGEFTRVSEVPTRGLAVFPGSGLAPDTFAPAAPSGLANPDPSGDKVTLDWSVPFDDRAVSHYRIYRNGLPLGETLDPHYVDWLVEENTEYSYQVQASDLAGNLSPLSAPFEVKTFTNLASAGDLWRHTDTPQHTAAWHDPAYNDSGWGLGTAELGYGDGDESTTLAPGSMTYYFRKTVTIPADQIAADAHLGLVRDDGAIVYINGQEAYRTNMPSGPVSPTTPASGTTGGSNESRWFEADIDPGLFQPGVNVIAVEVHQRSLGSSDVSFDLRTDVALTTRIFDQEPPTKPKGLKAVPKKATRIRVSWKAASDNIGVSGYRIFRDGVEIGITNDLFYKDDDVWPETEYTYKVYAIDTSGNESVRSRIRSATALADEDPPSRPKNATLTAGPTEITIDWDPANDNVGISHYMVKSFGVLLGTTTDTSYVYSGLEPNTEYHIVLRAVDVFGNKGKRKHLWITTPSVQTTYEAIAADHVWRYLDDGSDQGSGWSAFGFDDSSWDAATGEFGYGDGDETTVVASGPGNDRHITTYFRAGFDVQDAAAVAELELRLIRDDGVVVYLNGVEVYRDNMPAGPIDSETLASSGVTGSDERDWIVVTLPVEAIVSGENVLAVEVHQVHRTSSDVSLDVRLSVNP